MHKKLFLILFGLIALSLSACNIVRGSGDVITQSREVHNFDQVALSGVGTLYIAVGEQEALEIKAEDNLLPYIESRVSSSTLHIGFRDVGWNTALQPTEPIDYYLTVTDIEGLELSGAGNIQVDEIDTTQMRIRTSGAGNIEIKSLNAKVLTMDLSGAGSCRIHSGQVTDQNLRISGAGGYQASEVQSQHVSIDISGMGGAKVWAEDSLSVAISGAGSVDYYGQPNLSQDISGVGNIKSLGQK